MEKDVQLKYIDSLKQVRERHRQNRINLRRNPAAALAPRIEPFQPYRLYPKRNLEGNYKIKMIKGRNKSLRSRYRWKEQYMYQAHLFQFDTHQRETFEELKEFLTPLA